MESSSKITLAWVIGIVDLELIDLWNRFLTSDTKPLYYSPALAVVAVTPVLVAVLWAHRRWCESRREPRTTPTST